MPKKIDSEVKARAVRLVADHLAEYPSMTAASAAVGKQIGVGRETVRRWVLQAQIDDGTRGGVTSDELAEIKKLKAENRRLREDVDILGAATAFSAVPCVSRATRSPHEPTGPGAAPARPSEPSPMRRSSTPSETRYGPPMLTAGGS